MRIGCGVTTEMKKPWLKSSFALPLHLRSHLRAFMRKQLIYIEPHWCDYSDLTTFCFPKIVLSDIDGLENRQQPMVIKNSCKGIPILL